MSKPTFRPIQPLDVDDAALAELSGQMGVPKLVRPEQDMATAPSRPVFCHSCCHSSTAPGRSGDRAG